MEYSEKNTEFNVEFSDYMLRKVGSSDYSSLDNKPKINDITLEGNKTLDQLGIQAKGEYINKETLDLELEDVVEAFNTSMAHHYTKDEVDRIVEAINKLELVVVETLPETGEKGKVYLIEETQGSSVYGEFLWINSQWKKLGDTKVDLSAYALKSEIPILSDWVKQIQKPTYTKEEVGLENVDNVKQYSVENPPPYPVTSVNGKTGDVTGLLTYSNEYVEDCNTFLTNGYIKTNMNTTKNLPRVCLSKDKWGILLFISENEENGTGIQNYYPTDGSFKGEIFTRAITNGKTNNPSISEWKLVSTTQPSLKLAFTGNQFPTTWIAKTEGTEYNATDKYGEWTCLASAVLNVEHSVENAFDGNLSTYFASSMIGSDDDVVSCTIGLPKGISIRPEAFYLYYKNFKDGKIYGRNAETNQWELITSTTHSTQDVKEETISHTTSNYYNAFRVQSNRLSSAINYWILYDFQVTKGTLRII